jgi:hypothetical protein
MIGFNVLIGDIDPEPQSRIHAEFHSLPRGRSLSIN